MMINIFRSTIIFVTFLLILGTAYAQAPTSPGLLTSVITNDTSTGTTVNKLAKLTSSSKVVIAATTDTDGIIGVVLSGAGTTGVAQIGVNGVIRCVFDGTATAGDYVQISSSVAGDCKDAGVARPANVQVLGRVVTGGAGAGTYTIALQVNAPTPSTMNLGTLLFITSTGINFNSGNTDTILTLPSPPSGYTRYSIRNMFIDGASASLNPATVGLFTAAAGGGTVLIASGTAVTVTSTADSTANNMQVLSPVNVNTASNLYSALTSGQLYFRVQTASTVPATASISMQIQWLP